MSGVKLSISIIFDKFFFRKNSMKNMKFCRNKIFRKSRLSIASGLSTPFDCDDLEGIAKKLEDAASTSKR